jgi:hypothetical protein
VKYPLYLHEQAYQTRRSVETTIHALVCKTVRTPNDGLVSLGDCLVIDGVLDNITFASKCTEAEEHGVKHNVVMWTRATVSNEQNVTPKCGVWERFVYTRWCWRVGLDGKLETFQILSQSSCNVLWMQYTDGARPIPIRENLRSSLREATALKTVTRCIFRRRIWVCDTKDQESMLFLLVTHWGFRKTRGVKSKNFAVALHRHDQGWAWSPVEATMCITVSASKAPTAALDVLLALSLLEQMAEAKVRAPACKISCIGR